MEVWTHRPEGRELEVDALNGHVLIVRYDRAYAAHAVGTIWRWQREGLVGEAQARNLAQMVLRLDKVKQ